MSLRCNIFLACYIYPNLLYNKEWKNFFKNSLSQLWLEWGGIASLDKENSAFHKLHSGEKPNSYHQGDSWFWVNNLAAIVLSQVDKRGFQAYINKILQASSYDILWQGIIGHHSELSSARDFKAQGCLSQAWSSAMFIELCLYITKHKAQPTTNN
jgi:glycogen debranching enzyme